jgi:hypothetical protein
VPGLIGPTRPEKVGQLILVACVRQMAHVIPGAEVFKESAVYEYKPVVASRAKHEVPFRKSLIILWA